jgi:acyl carrier protein
MTREQLRDVILHLLREVAPEADLRHLSADERLCDALQLDALDFLNFVIAVHETLRVDVPEHDYAQLGTLGGCVDYLERARGERGARRGAAGTPEGFARPR